MKFSNFLPLAIFTSLSLFFLLKLFNFEESKNITSALIDKPFPQLTLPNLENKSKINAHVGKDIIVVNFFASWCAPCREEHEVFKEFSEDFFIIGVAYKDSFENLNNFLLELGNPYREIFLDSTGKSAIELGLYGVPETYFVDLRGVIKYKHVGPINRGQFKKYISKMQSL